MAFPKISKRRNNNVKLLEIMNEFESIESNGGTSGNIQRVFDGTFNLDTGKNEGSIFKGGKAFYECVSAPYLLAKLVASYPGLKIRVEGQEGYKITWHVALKHKESGHVITFYDWKGSASYGSDLRDKEIPKKFKSDVAKLLKALADNRFPHPYDGCVIGEVA